MNKNRHYRGGYQFAGLLELARDLRNKQTSAEALLWQMLRSRRLFGFKFRRQHQLGDYIADFYCYEAQLVIECEGSVHEANGPWNHDRERDAWMAQQGVRILRFTNGQVSTETEKVLEEISVFLPSPSGRRAGEEGLCDGQLRPSPQPSPKGRGRKTKALTIVFSFTSLLLVQIISIPAVVISQSNSSQNPVEIKGEPRHHPKFENEFVRIWDVTVPGGDATLWHAHRNDNVVVTLAPAKLHIETLGRDPVDAEWKYGEVRFSKATYVHRAMNVGTTPFHNLTIELLKPTNFVADPSALPVEEAGRTPILENERVRVYRLSLAPGEAQAMHTHPLPGLVVTITAAEIEVKAKGKPVTHPVKSNDVSWQAGGVTHSIKNVGQTTFESLIIQLK